MAKPVPNNVFAAKPAAPAHARPAPAKQFAGIGAKVQGRPGESLESMADRMHKPKR